MFYFQEVEEILELLKSTWRVLGITETMHYTCYAWVLFRQVTLSYVFFFLTLIASITRSLKSLFVSSQYVITSEQGMLQHAIDQLKKIPLKEQRGPQERLHLKSLLSKVEVEGGSQSFSFLRSFLLPIQKWADKQLGDYHLHFAEVGFLQTCQFYGLLIVFDNSSKSMCLI